MAIKITYWQIPGGEFSRRYAIDYKTKVFKREGFALLAFGLYAFIAYDRCTIEEI